MKDTIHEHIDRTPTVRFYMEPPDFIRLVNAKGTDVVFARTLRPRECAEEWIAYHQNRIDALQAFLVAECGAPAGSS